jgi:hypothetical protein
MVVHIFDQLHPMKYCQETYLNLPTYQESDNNYDSFIEGHPSTRGLQ